MTCSVFKRTPFSRTYSVALRPENPWLRYDTSTTAVDSLSVDRGADTFRDSFVEQLALRERQRAGDLKIEDDLP